MTREIKIMTPEHVELKFELAGLGSRFIALLLDTLLQIAVFIVLFLILFLALPALAHVPFAIDRVSPWVIGFLILFVFAITSGYFLYFEAAWNGQTPGKKAVSIRVIRDSGHPIDFRSAVLRNLMRFVDSLPGTYAIGIISVFFSPMYRRLGDSVAGTLVIKTSSATASEASSATAPPHFGQAASSPQPGTIETLQTEAANPYLHLITHQDYRAITHLLDRSPELDASVAHSLAARMAESLARRLQLDPVTIGDPELFLRNLATAWKHRMIH